MCGSRIEIEEEYVKKLDKLSKFSFPREEPFFGEKVQDPDATNVLPVEVLGALLQMPVQTAQVCAHHVTLLESLKQRLLWPLQQNLREQNMVKHQHKHEMLKIVKSKTAQQELAAKLKSKYYNRCKETALLADADVAGLVGKKLEKHEKRLKQAKEAEMAADSEYRSSIYKLSELHNQWQSRMVVSATEFQKLEETRLELVKHVLVEYGAIYQLHMGEIVGGYGRLQERASLCDRFVEMQEFIRKYGTGTTIPSPPVYSSNSISGMTSVEESMRRLSVHSPRKLYGSDSSLSSSSFSPPPSPPTSSARSFCSSAPSPAPRSSVSTLGAGIGDMTRGSICSPDPRRLMISRGSLSPSTTFSNDSRMTAAQAYDRRDSTALSSTHSFSAPSIATQCTTRAESSLFKFRVRTQHAYQAQEHDELSFKPGQTISVFSTLEEPWWYGQIEEDGHRGMFPSNYVVRI